MVPRIATTAVITLVLIVGLGGFSVANPGPDGAGDHKAVSIDGSFSGSWSDPDHDGEGWLLEVLAPETVKANGEKVPGTAVAYWFTYPAETPAQNKGVLPEQAWIVGVGSISANTISFQDAVITNGAVFGPGFDPTDVNHTTWGDFTFTFSGCDAGTLSYSSGTRRPKKSPMC